MVEATNVNVELGQPDWYDGSEQIGRLGKMAGAVMRSLLRATLEKTNVDLRDCGKGWQIIVSDENYTEFEISASLTDVIDDAIESIWGFADDDAEGRDRITDLAAIFEKAASDLRELATQMPPEKPA